MQGGKENYCSMSEYARIRGCSHEAVRCAIKSGRLVNSLREKQPGKFEIDPVVANLEWELNTDKSKQFNIKNKPTHPARMAPFIRDPTAPINVDNDRIDLASARLMKEKYAALLAELEFQQKSGILIPAEAVRHEAFKLGRSIRDSMMNIPDRVAAEFAGISDAAEIHMRLSEEIKQMLQALLKDAGGASDLH